MQTSEGQPKAAAQTAPDADFGGSASAFGDRRLPWLAVGLLVIVGAILRWVVTTEGMFADELSTYWIVSTNGLADVVDTVHSDAEITPPLFFILAWLAAEIDLTPEMLRLPSLLAGLASIPVMYLLGVRTVGRPAALVATAITALSPFMIYYSAEARGYAVLMLLVMLSMLAMLLAVDTRRVGWWLLYGACSCGVMYTHYTGAFALAAQLGWLLWAHPEARKPALVANAVAAVAFIPWLSGLRADLNSGTTDIFAVLNPFNWENVRVSLSHAAVGYPYSNVKLPELPGVPALILLGLGLLAAIIGIVRLPSGRVRAWLRRPDRRVMLVVAVAVFVPLGEALFSAVGTSVFGGRNLAPGWPAYALSLAALLVAAAPRWRVAASALVIGCFAIGALKMTDDRYQRPNYEAVADFVDARAQRLDAVVDGAVLSPGPLSPLDIAFDRPHQTTRLGRPAETRRPFGPLDPLTPEREVMAQAVRLARDGTIYVISIPGFAGSTPKLPARFRRVNRRLYRGTTDLKIEVWRETGSER